MKPKTFPKLEDKLPKLDLDGRLDAISNDQTANECLLKTPSRLDVETSGHCLLCL